MADLRIDVNDGTNANEKIVGGPILTRKAYTVASPAGINKNGKHYPQGSQVPLDEKTARNFAEAGDITMEDSTDEPSNS